MFQIFQLCQNHTKLILHRQQLMVEQCAKEIQKSNKILI